MHWGELIDVNTTQEHNRTVNIFNTPINLWAKMQCLLAVHAPALWPVHSIAGKLCKRCHFSHQVRLKRGDDSFVKHEGRPLKRLSKAESVRAFQLWDTYLVHLARPWEGFLMEEASVMVPLYLDLCPSISRRLCFFFFFWRQCLYNEGPRWEQGLQTCGFWHSQRSALHPSTVLYSYPSVWASRPALFNPSAFADSFSSLFFSPHTKQLFLQIHKEMFCFLFFVFYQE